MPRIVEIEANKTKKLKVCAYARVSSKKLEQEESFYCQKDYWENKLANNPKYEFVGIFGDEGVSGRSRKKRPQFEAMITQAKLGKIDLIFTKSMTRFARNLLETLEIVQELRDIGVGVVFENDDINTLTLTNALIFNIKAIISENDSKTISDNVRWSARKRYSQGSVEQNSRILGYDYIDKQLVVNEEQAKIVRLIFQLYIDGVGTTAIANKLTELGYITSTGKTTWARSTISGILCNEKYVGDALLQKSYKINNLKKKNRGEVKQYYVENSHEPIISNEVFAKVQEMRKQKTENLKIDKFTNKYELSGKIFCGNCGSKFTRRINHKVVNFTNNVRWSCYTQNQRGIHACESHMISDELLKEIIVDAYNEYLKTPKQNELTYELEERLNELTKKDFKLRDYLKQGLINPLKFNREIEKVKHEYDIIDKQLMDSQSHMLYKKFGKPIEEYDPSIVDNHIEKIIMKDWTITFVFNNKQEITKEFKYEHRKHCKNY